MGNVVGLSDVPDPSVSSCWDSQVILELCHSHCGATLVRLVAGHSPSIEVRLKNLGSEVVVIVLRIVSIFLKEVSVMSQNSEHCQLKLPDNTPLVLE